MRGLSSPVVTEQVERGGGLEGEEGERERGSGREGAGRGGGREGGVERPEVAGGEREETDRQTDRVACLDVPLSVPYILTP